MDQNDFWQFSDLLAVFTIAVARFHLCALLTLPAQPATTINQSGPKADKIESKRTRKVIAKMDTNGSKFTISGKFLQHGPHCAAHDSKISECRKDDFFKILALC